MHSWNTQVLRNNCHTEQVSHFSMPSWYAALCFDGTIQHFPVFKVQTYLILAHLELVSKLNSSIMAGNSHF